MKKCFVAWMLLGVALCVFAGGGRNRVVEAPLEIKPLSRPVTMDGDLEEWNRDDAVLLTLAQSKAAGDSPGVYAKYAARVAMQYDNEFLYVGIWWTDDTPMGSKKTPGIIPAGDGLVLSTGKGTNPFIAFYYDPVSKSNIAVALPNSLTDKPGRPLPEVRQGFKKAAAGYMQEIAIPWKTLGMDPEKDVAPRFGIELALDGMDGGLGYRTWWKEKMSSTTSGNRWGGDMGWGIMDGIAKSTQVAATFDPNSGALVELKPSGAIAPPNPAVMDHGNELTRTTKMIAVPARKMVVDGKLSPDEWEEASGTVISIEPTLFPNRYATKVFWAYAPEGLYVGLRFLTGGPHQNVSDPRLVRHGYDGGDAVQVRLATDKVSHVDAWYFDAAKIPAMSITYGARFNEGKLDDALPKGAKTAISPIPGGGYEQEIFLPWALITESGKAPAGSFRAVLDLFYGGDELNRIPFIVNGKVIADRAVATLPFTAPKDAFYTLEIVDEAGKGVRRLLAATRLKKGEIVKWDGLDNEGKAVPVGKYGFRGLYHDGIETEYLMSFDNPGTPAWQTVDGRGEWGGDHCPPQAVATDANGVYLGWSAAEDGSGLIGTDFSGQRQWGFFQTPYPTGNGSALLAVDNGKLYFVMDRVARSGKSLRKGEKLLAYFDTVISVHDAKNGNCVDFSLKKPYITLKEYTVEQTPSNWFADLYNDNKNFTVDNSWVRDFYYFSDRMAGACVSGIAARQGKVYLSMRFENQVKVYDAATMEEKTAWPLEKPGALAFDEKGKLFALSANTVVELNVADGKVLRTPVSNNLKAAAALALDGKGNFYVGDWADQQCVKVFDASGKFVRTIGKVGGRGWIGKFDRDGMLFPHQLAVDKNGKLWVAENEDAPRRVSVWNAANGKFEKHFIGGSTYGGVTGGYLDPKDPTIAFANNTVFKLDYTKKSYEPISTLWRRTSHDEYWNCEIELGSPFKMFRRNGKTFIAVGSRDAMTIGELTSDYRYIPRVAIGGIFSRSDNERTLAGREKELLWRMSLPPPVFKGKGGFNYIWTDLNGDGKAQPDEMQFHKIGADLGMLDSHWGMGDIDKDFTLYVTGREIGETRLYGFPVIGWTEFGPKYSFEKLEKLAPYTGRLGGMMVDKNKNFIMNEFGEYRKNKKDPHITSYAPDGKINWRIPTVADHRAVGSITGEKILPFMTKGELGEVLTFTQWHGCQMPILTTDGLYVGRILRDPAEGGEDGPDVYRGETIQAITQMDDGRIILAHGKNAHHLFDIKGLDAAKRFKGNFALNAAEAAEAAANVGKAAKAAADTAPVPLPILSAPIKVDGDLGEWDRKTAVSVGGEKAPNAKIMLRSDEKNLYFAYEVNKGAPYRNDGKNVNQLFLSGDVADFQFSSNPLAQPGRRMGMGDRRIVFGKFNGKDVAVFYEAATPGAKNPQGFSSPTRTINFDSVSVIAKAEVVIKDTATGYVVEASVPLKPYIIDNTLWPKRLIAGDVGIVLGDATGRRVARLYRFNRDTLVVNDIPSESELRPENWGTLEVIPEVKGKR